MALFACSPKFDWRDVLPEQAPFAISLPGKPAQMSRNVNLDGQAAEMQMHGARAGGLAFTAAWARLNEPALATESGDQPAQIKPQQTKAERIRVALTAMQTGMVNNISGEITKQETRNIALLGAQGEKAGLLPAVFIDAVGQSRGQAVRMQAMFAAVGDDLMQFVVVGEPFSAEAAATFFESVQARVRVKQSP